MTLSALLADIAPVGASQDRQVAGLSMDSRTIQPGELFLACRGQQVHGHCFTAEAIARGAVAVVYESGLDPVTVPAHRAVPQIPVSGLHHWLGLIANRGYRFPSQDMTVIGVTGTNGKTSCCHFLAQVLDSDQIPCGIIGTLGTGRVGRLSAGSRTTPDVITVHRTLGEMRRRGIRQVAMEVSSHGLDQNRVEGVKFDVALFTNLSRDHLDYHPDLQAYAQAKRRLFTGSGITHAVINRDDTFGQALLHSLPVAIKPLAYGLGEPRSELTTERWVQGLGLVLDRTGMAMDIQSHWGNAPLRCALLGRFNAHNLLGVLGVLLALEMPLSEAVRRLAKVQTVPGRMECFGGPGQAQVVVDYAHTPEALRQALTALRPHCGQTLWCVFGCGGERDPGKRPLMGRIAEQLADRVILTDDNPRSEDPRRIVQDILSGMARPQASVVEHERAKAIAGAIEEAGAGDVILIAGKGHEESQWIGGTRRFFSDRAWVRKLLARELTRCG